MTSMFVTGGIIGLMVIHHRLIITKRREIPASQRNGSNWAH